MTLLALMWRQRRQLQYARSAIVLLHHHQYQRGEGGERADKRKREEGGGMRDEGGRGRGRGQRGRERTKGVSDLESHNHHHHDHCHHLSSPRCIIRSHHWPRAIDHPPRPSWHQGCEEVTRWARDAQIVRTCQRHSPTRPPPSARGRSVRPHVGGGFCSRVPTEVRRGGVFVLLR